MSNKQYTVPNLEKLLKLQRIRIATAEEVYRESQIKFKKIQVALLKRQARIEHMRAQLDMLKEFRTRHGVVELVRFSGFANARQCWLEHDLERDEYWLKDDVAELKQADREVIEKRRLWLRARVHETRIQGLVKKAKLSMQLFNENRLESEIEEISMLSREGL